MAENAEAEQAGAVGKKKSGKWGLFKSKSKLVVDRSESSRKSIRASRSTRQTRISRGVSFRQSLQGGENVKSHKLSIHIDPDGREEQFLVRENATAYKFLHAQNAQLKKLVTIGNLSLIHI